MLGIKLMQNKTQTALSDVLFPLRVRNTFAYSFMCICNGDSGMIVSEWLNHGCGRVLACRRDDDWAQSPGQYCHLKKTRSSWRTCYIGVRKQQAKPGKIHPSSEGRRESQEGVNGVYWMPLGGISSGLFKKADLKTQQVCTEMVYFGSDAKEWGKLGSGELSNWHPLDKWDWTFSGVKKIALNCLSDGKKKQWSISPSPAAPVTSMGWKFPCIARFVSHGS